MLLRRALRHMLMRILGSLLPVLFATAHFAGVGRADPCPTAAGVTGDWRSYDEGAFTVRMPASLQRESIRGIDSQVGYWRAKGVEIGYDYGMYSNPLRSGFVGGSSEVTVCSEGATKEDPRVIIVRMEDGRYFAGAHWPAVETVPFGRSSFSRSLTLSGTVTQPEDLPLLLAVLHTVRFTR